MTKPLDTRLVALSHQGDNPTNRRHSIGFSDPQVLPACMFTPSESKGSSILIRRNIQIAEVVDLEFT